MKLIRMMDNYINDKKYCIIYKNNNLNIINYSEIIDFSSNLISVRYDDNVCHISGDNLVISKMIDNEILIEGNISSIIFD